MNENTTTKKVTKAQRNMDIIAMLKNEDVRTALATFKAKYGTTADDAIAHLTHENELLAKKNTTTGTKKLTKAQQENENFKTEILEFMEVNPNRAMTATEVMNEVLATMHPTIVWTNQKVASLLNALSDKKDKDTGEILVRGKLERVEGKGKSKTTFQIRTATDMVEMDEDAE